MRQPPTLSPEDLDTWEAWVGLSSWASTCSPREYEAMELFIRVLKRSDNGFGAHIMSAWNNLQSSLIQLS